jgi:hypothetical protein
MSIDELFSPESVEMLSPRLRWMQKHSITTIHNKNVSVGQECELTGEPLYTWCATKVGIQSVYTNRQAGFGMSEEDACADLAAKNGWKLWNETED